jgi:dUTP pyrophosphatase
MNIKIKRIDPDLPRPFYSHKGDAGFDLRTRENVSIIPGEKATLPTGLALEIPQGYVGLIWDKSGLAIKEGLKTLGGVIDSTYRGEVMVGLVNLSKNKYTFKKGDKVAQMLIQKVKKVDFEEVEELESSDRGSRGFGSTGKR